MFSMVFRCLEINIPRSDIVYRAEVASTAIGASLVNITPNSVTAASGRYQVRISIGFNSVRLSFRDRTDKFVDSSTYLQFADDKWNVNGENVDIHCPEDVIVHRLKTGTEIEPWIYDLAPFLTQFRELYEKRS